MPLDPPPRKTHVTVPLSTLLALSGESSLGDARLLFLLMAACDKENGVSATLLEMADALGMQKPAISKIMTRLISMGAVKRVQPGTYRIPRTFMETWGDLERQRRLKDERRLSLVREESA